MLGKLGVLTWVSLGVSDRFSQSRSDVAVLNWANVMTPSQWLNSESKSSRDETNRFSAYGDCAERSLPIQNATMGIADFLTHIPIR